MNWLTDSTAFAYTYTLYGNLMCSLLYLTYDAVQNGVLRYLALSLVSKPAEQLWLHNLVFLLRSVRSYRVYVFLTNFLSTFILFSTKNWGRFMDHPVHT